ncbi:MAG: tetratricopeptide repeat protein [Bacteroidota bacterium]
MTRTPLLPLLMRLAPLVLAALVVLPALAPLWAQRPTIRTVPRQAPQSDQDGVAAKFRLADQLLRAGQEDRAIALLEDLRADDPGSQAVFLKLKYAYVQTKRFEEAIQLVIDHIERVGATADLLAELGSLHYQMGDTATASVIWNRVLEDEPLEASTYRSVYTAQVRSRLYEDAAGVLEQGRVALDSPTLFRSELAQVYDLLADYPNVAREYLGIIAERPDRVAVVKSRFARSLDDPEAAAAYRAAIDAAIREDPLQLAFRDLSMWLALETSDYRAGFDASRAFDRLGAQDGNALLAFARSAQDAAEQDAATGTDALTYAEEAYMLLLDTYPASPLAGAARYSLATLHEQRATALNERAFDPDGTRAPAPNYEQALTGYAAYADAYPTGPFAESARQRVAALQQRVFRDYAAAETVLRDLARTSRTPEVVAEARLSLGTLAFLRDDLTRARLAFQQVEEEVRIGETAERARLELATLDFYVGDLDGALARVKAMNENTATQVANDAITLKLLLNEHRGPDSTDTALKTYAEAARYVRQDRPAEALPVLDSLDAQFAQHPIGDEAAFLRAEALRASGRTPEALTVLEALPERFPRSYLGDRALFLRAEILEQDAGDLDAARAAYTDLLTRYPGSLLLPDARARIRALRGDGV